MFSWQLSLLRLTVPLDILLGLLLFPTLCIAQSDDATVHDRVIEALESIDDAQYDDAADEAQSLIDNHPDLPYGYEIRGVLGLYYGGVRRARTDFKVALSADAGNPDAQFGLALCDIDTRDYSSAEADLNAAKLSPMCSKAQTSDIDTVNAYIGILQHHYSAAISFAGPEEQDSDPARLEILAFLRNHESPGSGDKILRRIVTSSDGVPHLVEPDGIRPSFLDNDSALEPSVEDPDICEMYRSRLVHDVGQSQHEVGRLTVAIGQILLRPPRLPNNNSPNLVSYYVDGHCDLIVNSYPFTYEWDTTNVPNGRHRVRIDISDSGGTVLYSKEYEYDVQNQESLVVGSQTGTVEPSTSDIDFSLWERLRLRPSYKAAAFQLSVDESTADGNDRSEYYRAVAAAINPDYRGGRVFMEKLLTKQFSKQPAVVWQGSVGSNRVALTFDDGPNAIKTPPLLDALDRCHIPATFFVVGSRAGAFPGLIDRMRERGDEIENHSFTHPNMAQSTPLAAEEEILRNEVMVKALDGRYPRFFRPPGGNSYGMVSKLTRRYGLTLAFWTVDALALEYAGDPEALVNYVMKRLHPGDIILMHNAPITTTRALPALVEALSKRGFKCVRLSEIGASPVPARPGRTEEAAAGSQSG